ncbi:MAG: SurA N-terminal domain-containing protein [Candidatus Shapirobacteria bacterium]|nr:SurA N-terminal domain-containing protein [Candidatus Shapirobacteria bacterium]MDD3003124.1 SurA N-terminal domain-containing protein [Candidatus Shapirobacteria bacterium]MDD4383184.1 SurA N-terminal domain-containing protein [Candidatus Shapirobacteria bacterium]
MKKIIKKTNKKEVVDVKNAVEKKIPKKKFAMKKMSRVATIHLISFLVLLAFAAGCFYKFGIVATVNGKPIYRHSYIAQLQKQDKQTVLSQMVQDALIAGEAKNKGIVINQEEIDKGLTAIEDQVKAQGTTLDEAMKAQGVTREEVMSQIRTQKIAEALASPSAEITKEQIDAFLKENKAYLPTGKNDNELQMLAKEQLETQAKNTALSTWFSNLKSSAKIIYK